MASDRFDLEQAILECWNVVSDIRLLSEEVMEGDLSKDQLTNILIALDHLYDIKFNKLFRIFEEIIAQNSVKELESRVKYSSNDEPVQFQLVEDEKVPF